MIQAYSDRTINIQQFNRAKPDITHPDAKEVQAEIKALQELFKQDANGQVTAQEFDTYMSAADKQTQSLFDTDGNGSLDKKEIEAAWINALSLANPEETFTTPGSVRSTEGTIFSE